MSSVRREADVSAETSTVRPGDFIVYIIIIFLMVQRENQRLGVANLCSFFSEAARTRRRQSALF